MEIAAIGVNKGLPDLHEETFITKAIHKGCESIHVSLKQYFTWHRLSWG